MTEKKSSKKGILYGMIAIIVLLFAYIVYQHFHTQNVIEEKVSIGIEKNELLTELTEMQSQYDTLYTDKVELQAEMDGQQLKIDSMLTVIKKHKGDAWTIHQLRKETESLRVIMKGFLHTIDSLNTMNIELTAENTEIKGQLNQEIKRTKNLEKKSEDLSKIITKGSQLQALDMWAGTIKIRNNGAQVETDRASKADKIKSCFTLSENNIAKSGTKKLYFRVISPEGKVLTDENSKGQTFDYDGVKGIYTMIRKVDYENNAMDVCIYWDIPTPLTPGFFIVEVYADEALIGRTSFDLK
jgi:hypothetical protein